MFGLKLYVEFGLKLLKLIGNQDLAIRSAEN